MKGLSKIVLGVLVAFIALAFMQCKPDTQAQKKAELKEEINHTIDDIDQKITEIRQNTQNASQDVKDKWDGVVADLEDSKHELQRKLDRMDDQFDSGWEDFQEDVDRGLRKTEAHLKQIGHDIHEAFQG